MLFEAIGFMIEQGWRVLTSVKFPGIDLSIASIVVGSLVAITGIKVIKMLLDFNANEKGK